MPPASFYFDLASPLAYLAAERVLDELPGPAAWQPVLTRRLAGAETFESFRCAQEQDIFRAETERRAAELGLQPLRWPQPFPFDSELAMRAATYACSIGRGVAFAQVMLRMPYFTSGFVKSMLIVLLASVVIAGVALLYNMTLPVPTAPPDVLYKPPISGG